MEKLTQNQLEEVSAGQTIVEYGLKTAMVRVRVIPAADLLTKIEPLKIREIHTGLKAL